MMPRADGRDYREHDGVREKENAHACVRDEEQELSRAVAATLFTLQQVE